MSTQLRTGEALARLSAAHQIGLEYREILILISEGRQSLAQALSLIDVVTEICSLLPPILLEESLRECKAQKRTLQHAEPAAALYQWNLYLNRLTRQRDEWERDLEEETSSTPEALVIARDLLRALEGGTPHSGLLQEILAEFRTAIPRLPPARRHEAMTLCVALEQPIRQSDYTGAAYPLRLFLRRCGQRQSCPMSPLTNDIRPSKNSTGG